jgi:hypothetical protein
MFNVSPANTVPGFRVNPMPDAPGFRVEAGEPARYGFADAAARARPTAVLRPAMFRDRGETAAGGTNAP